MAWALVTGASGGIGQAFAQHLAAHNVDVVLASRNTSALEQVADQLRHRYSVRAEVRGVDLIDTGARTQLAEGLAHDGITIDTLVNNAGFGTLADFVSIDPGRLNDEVALNCQAVVHLSRLFLPDMLQARHGSIINIASTAAFQPIPTMATYAATKAFVLRFSEGLWSETRGTGVRVIAVCPGPTETAFFANAGEDSAMSRRRSPEQVVGSCFRALDKGLPSVTDGVVNAVQGRLASVLPARVVAPVSRLVVRPH